MEDLASPNSLSADLADADLLLNKIQVSYLSAMQDMQANGAVLGRISNMFGVKLLMLLNILLHQLMMMRMFTLQHVQC